MNGSGSVPGEQAEGESDAGRGQRVKTPVMVNFSHPFSPSQQGVAAAVS